MKAFIHTCIWIRHFFKKDVDLAYIHIGHVIIAIMADLNSVLSQKKK